MSGKALAAGLVAHHVYSIRPAPSAIPLTPFPKDSHPGDLMKNRMTGRIHLVFWLLIAVVAGPLSSGMVAIAEEDAAAIEKRLAEAIGYLAADERDGRGPGTEGIDEAADYIAQQFQQIGLETKVFGETPFQTFTLKTQATLGKNNTLTFVGPPPRRGRTPSESS